MKDLHIRIQEAQGLLSPHAVPIGGMLGRKHPEEPDTTRFPFQRDRDRIIHSLSFRRLKGKTQVFVSGVGDHYRTRLTHTMEVAQISRDIARTLGLNEDLAECIALAHDLGHPPFGHAGEEALDDWMKSHGSSFEHNRQSLRIVTELESHSRLYKGLNLNSEVLEGLMKHRTPHDEGAEGAEGTEGTEVVRLPSLEAQVVNIADEIAYTGHDVDDGIRAKLFTIDDLKHQPLIKKAKEVAERRGTRLRGAIIHLLVMDLYAETEKRIADQKIVTLDDVYERADDPVRFSSEMRRDLDALRSFLWQHMYLHPEVMLKANEGKETVITLCDRYLNDPPEKVLELQKKHGSDSVTAVKDYVAGMTDDFAAQSRNGEV